MLSKLLKNIKKMFYNYQNIKHLKQELIKAKLSEFIQEKQEMINDEEKINQLQTKLYSALSKTGYVDRDVFYDELKKYTKNILSDQLEPIDQLLLNLGECLIEVGGDPQILCSEKYLSEITAQKFLETIAPNRIRFHVIPDCQETDN